MSQFTLPRILGAYFAVWIVSCVAAHGFSVLVYLGLHAATTGLFVYGMARADARHTRTRRNAHVTARRDGSRNSHSLSSTHQAS